MSFSNQLVHVKNQIARDVANYVSTARFGISLRIVSSRSMVVRAGTGDGGIGIGEDETGGSGISAMQTYPARRAMYSQSATAKYPSVTRKTTMITTRQGAIWMKASGTDTSVVATLKATRCANPVHVLTANTGPGRSRKKATAAESAPSVSSPSRTANTQASESSQFKAGHAMQINPANGRKKMKTRPGRGCESGEAKPARIAAPAKARIADRATATRRKFGPVSERKGRASLAVSFSIVVLLAESL